MYRPHQIRGRVIIQSGHEIRLDTYLPVDQREIGTTIPGYYWRSDHGQIKHDSGTHIKCLLDSFDEEANQLELAAREVDWERQIAIQLMIRGGLPADEITNLTHDRR